METQRRLEAEDLGRRIELTRQFLDKQRAKLRPDETPLQRASSVIEEIRAYPGAMHRWVESQGTGPQPYPRSHGDILLAQLLTSLDPRVLAALPDMEQFEWSDHPVRMERQLPPSTARFLDEFKETEDRILTLVDEQGRTNLDSQGLDDQVRRIFARILKPARLPGGIGKVILSGGRFGSQGYYFRVSLYTPSGEMRCRSGGVFYFDERNDPRYQHPSPKTLNATIGSLKGRTVELGTLAKEFLVVSKFADRANQFRRTKAEVTAPPSKALLDLLCAPEAHEPLGISVGEAVLATSDPSHPNVVACLPDGLQASLRGADKNGTIALDKFLDDAVIRRLVEVDMPARWIELRPAEPLATELARVSRPALGRFLREARSERKVDLKNLARFHWQAGRPALQNAVSRACRVALLESEVLPLSVSYNAVENYEILALLGSLSDAEWNAMVGGQTLDIGGLPGARKALLWARSAAFPERDPAVTMPEAQLERTVSRPTGPVPGISLSMTVDDIPAVQAIGPTKNPDQTFLEDSLMEAEPIASNIAWEVMSRRTSVEAMMPDLYHVGKMKRTHTTIRFAPGVLLEDEWISEPRVDLTSKPVHYKDLPPAFRQALEKLVDDLAKEFRG